MVNINFPVMNEMKWRFEPSPNLYIRTVSNNNDLVELISIAVL